MTTALDLDQAPLESVKELHRQAETCLAGTVQLAISADQRATTMAGIFGAGVHRIARGRRHSACRDIALLAIYRGRCGDVLYAFRGSAHQRDGRQTDRFSCCGL
jgi:hypothetical protein